MATINVSSCRSRAGIEMTGLFTKENSIYNKEKDVYECPAGKDIPFSFVSTDKGKPLRAYMSVMTCKGCTMRGAQHHQQEDGSEDSMMNIMGLSGLISALKI